jgi:dTDP-4-amino-4,6-dideoxygalactose transaminase
MRLQELAILGGRPRFAETLHVGRPNVPDRDAVLARVADVLDRRWLTNDGPCVRELEERLCAFLGVRHCVLTCNGTVALEIAIRAAGLTGEVIVPSLTFVATAHALAWQGVTPVFCDVDRRTHNLDARLVDALVTPRTTGIVGVHLWGRPCDTEALDAVARRRGLVLLYDAAHAFGCSHRGRMIGGFGRAEVLSFHATKVWNTLEGGAIATDDDALAARARLMRNFGFEGYDRVGALGTNGKMNEVSAAVGLVGLDGLDAVFAVNRRNHERYRRNLAGLPGVAVVAYDDRERANRHYVVIEVDEADAGIARDRLVQVLWAENVMARRYFHPGCHAMEPYRSLVPPAWRRLPETERLAARLLTLPTGTAVDETTVDAVCEIVRVAVERAPDLERAMAGARAHA